jgi:hypothetical protein
MTKLDAATSRLYHLGVIMGEFENNQGSKVILGNLDLLSHSIYQGIDLHQDAGTISGVHLYAESTINPDDLKNIWRRYSPEAVVQDYGPPSRIVVQAVEGVRGVDFAAVPYGIWLFYDQLKAAINYQGTSIDNHTYTICPVFRSSGNLTGHILLYTLPPSATIGLDEFIGDALGISETRWKLEDVTDLTIPEFTELITSADSSPCIETSIEIHPDEP